MSNTINPAMLAVALDRIETLVSAVLAKYITTADASPLIERDFAELRALLGLDSPPTSHTGRRPSVKDTAEAALAGKMEPLIRAARASRKAQSINSPLPDPPLQSELMQGAAGVV